MHYGDAAQKSRRVYVNFFASDFNSVSLSAWPVATNDVNIPFSQIKNEESWCSVQEIKIDFRTARTKVWGKKFEYFHFSRQKKSTDQFYSTRKYENDLVCDVGFFEIYFCSVLLTYVPAFKSNLDHFSTQKKILKFLWEGSILISSLLCGRIQAIRMNAFDQRNSGGAKTMKLQPQHQFWGFRIPLSSFRQKLHCICNGEGPSLVHRLDK